MPPLLATCALARKSAVYPTPSCVLQIGQEPMCALPSKRQHSGAHYNHRAVGASVSEPLSQVGCTESQSPPEGPGCECTGRWTRACRPHFGSLMTQALE